MAWPQFWTLFFMAVVSTLEAVNGSPDGNVQKESRAVPLRQKREWVWNSLFVEEERPAPSPYKIGHLASTKMVDGRRFEIGGEGANNIFIVDQSGGLFVTRSLDREEKRVYNLTATMRDRINKIVEEPEDFAVYVTDINDNIPVFARTYNGSIVERSPIGTKVVEARATDADDPSTANGELRYSLTQDGDLSAFEIDGTTGMISCKINTLDRETMSEYVVVVKAQDMRGMASGSTATTSVTISIRDSNDNIASFTRTLFELQVQEDHKLNEKIGILELEDRDQIQNKVPIFTISSQHSKVFDIELDPHKHGILVLKQALDYEITSSYAFTVQVRENLRNLQFPADNVRTAITTAQIKITVLDVDEPPVFSQPLYTFEVVEERMAKIGTVTAMDPDQAKKTIQYSILDKDCPININPLTGQLSTLRPLDRELEATHMFQVRAQEEPSGLESFVKVHIMVQDVNDNKPELIIDEVFVCEKDVPKTVIGTLRATDKDDQHPAFSFDLHTESSNFSIRDHGNNSADILVEQGTFSLNDPKDYSIEVRVSDGGRPIQTSITTLAIKSCRCDARRIPTQCNASARRMSVSVHALITILLCITTILVFVILFVLRKRYQKESLANMKNSGEIHEQLVTYDEEGGGEMDTNGYNVSVLSSAFQDNSLLHNSEHLTRPSLYAMVQKAPHPTACKGDMAVMIEVKKDEADHDREGFPYDTLHIYGYEGPESVAGTLSSLESSSAASNLDYDFLNDWGPRFRTLAELYGVDAADFYHQY